MSNSDDLARAASDAVDAWCAANPAPTWPTSGQWFKPDAKPVKVTYTRYVSQEEFLETLTDEQKQETRRAAQEFALFSRGNVDEIYSTLINVMANYRSSDE